MRYQCQIIGRRIARLVPRQTSFCSRSKKVFGRIRTGNSTSINQMKQFSSSNSISTLTTNQLFSWFVFREQQPISLLPHLSHSKQPPDLTSPLTSTTSDVLPTQPTMTTGCMETFFSPAFTPLHNATPKSGRSTMSNPITV